MGDDPPPMRVLYIDDDPAMGRLVQLHLGRAGWDVTLAGNAASGLPLIRSGTFDVVALDHYMPGKDGLDILGELGDGPDLPPVVFVTAAEDARIAVAALKAGAADYVVKDVQGPFLDLLHAALRQALAQVRMRQAKEAAEQQVRRTLDRLEQLTEKQAILLREVNHRVANSLQLISSLITLQAGRVGGEAAAVLRHAATRVEAVMLVHRRLYTSDDVRTVAMQHYLGGLIEELERSSTDSGLRLRLAAEDVSLPTDTAVGFGLIVNELVSNAVKYAYPDHRPGEVRVHFTRPDPAHVELVVEDDGVGLSPQEEPRGTGLGSVIITAMARTMNADVIHDLVHAGTRILVRLHDRA